MDFDGIDDPVISFDDAVRSAREDVMKGQSMNEAWMELVDKKSFFKDIAQEARVRGKLFGGVLVACEALTLRIHTAITLAEASTSTDAAEARLLVTLAKMYVKLYTTTPVPSVEQWRKAVRTIVCGDAAAADGATATISSDDLPMLFGFPVTSNSGAETNVNTTAALSMSQVYAAHIAEVARPSASASPRADQEEKGKEEIDCESAVSADDGSTSEEEFKLFLKRCVTLSRKSTRGLQGDEAQHVKDMIGTINRYVSEGTLEW